MHISEYQNLSRCSEAQFLISLADREHVHGSIGLMRHAGFIRVFDLEAEKLSADIQSHRFTKACTSEMPYLFSIPMTDRQRTK